MEHYFLLRDNRESGPYSLKELKAKGLYPTDLLWIDGESTCWKHPAELGELAAFVSEPERKQRVEKASPAAPAVRSEMAYEEKAEVTDYEARSFSTTDTRAQVEQAIRYTASFDEQKENYSFGQPRKNAWKQNMNIGANLIGLVTLVIGVMLSAVMVKKAVDNIEYEPEEASPTADAREIVSESLPRNATHHAALANAILPAAKSNEPVTGTLPKKDSVAAKNVVKEHKTEAKNVAEKEVKEANPSPATDEKNKAMFAKNDDKSNAAGTEEKDTVSERKTDTEEAGKAAGKASLQLSANAYKVGLFGGISNLQLSVTNASTQAVDQAIVEVEYLKPNGKVVGSKTVEVASLAPGATKTVSVPDNGRGVSVRYHVVNR